MVYKKKKIAFVISSLLSGGAERVVVTLANKFVSKFDVLIIVLYKTEILYDINKNVKIHFIKDEYTPSNGIFDAIKNNAFYFINVFRLGKHYKVDLFISFATIVNCYTIFSSILLNKPILISERNNPKENIPFFLLRILRNVAYLFANVLIVQTDFIKNFYKKIISKNKIIVIPNPMDGELLIKRRFYKERENIILTVGRLDTNKNQRILIESFANLNPENWKLIIVGDGILREDYRKLVKDLNIEQKVEFVGNVHNVWDYYNQAKIFAFTSNSEGFPNALLEAMSFGLPCISTDCPSGPSEIIINDENGYLIEVNNREQLEDRLYKLMNNPEICNQFSINAISTTQEFSMVEVNKLWEIQIQKFL